MNAVLIALLCIGTQILHLLWMRSMISTIWSDLQSSGSHILHRASYHNVIINRHPIPCTESKCTICQRSSSFCWPLNQTKTSLIFFCPFWWLLQHSLVCLKTYCTAWFSSGLKIITTFCRFMSAMASWGAADKNNQNRLPDNSRPMVSSHQFWQ